MKSFLALLAALLCGTALATTATVNIPVGQSVVLSGVVTSNNQDSPGPNIAFIAVSAAPIKSVTLEFWLDTLVDNYYQFQTDGNYGGEYYYLNYGGVPCDQCFGSAFVYPPYQFTVDHVNETTSLLHFAKASETLNPGSFSASNPYPPNFDITGWVTYFGLSLTNAEAFNTRFLEVKPAFPWNGRIAVLGETVTYKLTITAVPEPASAMLATLGLMVIATARRRGRAQAIAKA